MPPLGHIPATLAQADPQWDASRILWSVLALAVAVIVLGVVALLIRRWMLKQDEPSATPGFTLADMRRLRDQGELSDEEYERARATLIGRTRQSLDTSTPASDPHKPNRDHPPTHPPEEH